LSASTHSAPPLTLTLTTHTAVLLQPVLYAQYSGGTASSQS
jgi:hypothetical protein